MSRHSRDDPQPWYREWRDAAEDDITVPHEVMAIIGAYARHLESEGGPIVSVSRRQLRRYTHLSMSALQTAHKYAERHGWLVRQPTPDGADERSVYYLTEIGHSGEPRGLRGRPVPDRSVPRSNTTPSHGTTSLRPTEQLDRSVPRNDMLRPTERSTAERSVPRSPTSRSREISRSISLRPGSPRDLLRQLDESVDDAVVGAVVAILQERGAQNPASVLYTEIDAGRGPALIAVARQQLAAHLSTADQRPAALQFRDLCPRCSRLRHDPVPCPDREPSSTPGSSAGSVSAVDTGEPCLAGEHCLQPPSPADPATGYHVRCSAVASAWASLAERATAPAAGSDPAAEQVAEARALREAAERAQAETVAS
jgi:hypothetical protein